jgi:hypothetical protein
VAIGPACSEVANGVVTGGMTARTTGVTGATGEMTGAAGVPDPGLLWR